jgi:hypothetical protein
MTARSKLVGGTGNKSMEVCSFFDGFLCVVLHDP